MGRIAGIAIVISIFVVVVVLYWWGFQWLWNAAVVGIFHLPYRISYWQAAILSTLIAVIGGLFGKGGSK